MVAIDALNPPFCQKLYVGLGWSFKRPYLSKSTKADSAQSFGASGFRDKPSIKVQA